MKKNFCFLALVVAVLLAVASPVFADLISEFQPNAAGTDPDPATVELSDGTAGAAFNLWLISIENDGFDGVIDRAANVTGTYDANGLAVVSVPDLENPSFTYVLTDSFTGSVGDDIDANDDGTMLDLTSFGTILDAVGIADSTSDAMTLYGGLIGGVDLGYTGDEPGLVFRDASTGSFFAINEPNNGTIFDQNGMAVTGTFDTTPTLAGTFGSINPTLTAAIPEPSSLTLLGLASIGLITRRRRS